MEVITVLILLYPELSIGFSSGSPGGKTGSPIDNSDCTSCHSTTSISGSNITFDANRSQIFKTDQGPGSDSSAALHQLRDEYYIDFTPSEGPTATAGKYYVKFGPNFSVSQSGVLFASGAVFEGQITASTGLIGGA